MATTRIIPMHINTGKTLAQCLSDRTDYAKNPDKTDDGKLISSYECDALTADAEFLLSKRQYRILTGRVQESDVIAYQIRQSFKPGESHSGQASLTAEEANQLGYEFAKRFTKSNHAFIVCTHTDKSHIHNHIIWNSTTLDCTRKFRNFWGSTEAVRKLSDLICAEHRLSVIENPQPHGKSYNKWRGGEAKLCNRDLLRAAIDAALSKKPKDFEAFLKLLESSGYKVKRGKNITFAHEGQKQNIRLRSLGTGYSEEELRSVIAGSKTHIPKKKKKYLATPKPRLITSIEESLNSGKGAAYDNKIKVSMLKEMAHTFLYLEEQDFPDYEALAASVDDSKAKFYALSEKIKAAEKRMAEIAVLKTHIINYSKTRDVYTEYRKAGYSKKFLAEHESDIILHKAAKKAFDDLGMKKLPTVKTLQTEYAALLAEKKAAYAGYNAAQTEMRTMLIHKANAEYILNLNRQDEDRTRERQHEEK